MPTPKIDLSRLPITDATLYGRNDELQLLQASWEDPSTKILSFIAWGGVGKSALVNTWLNNMEAKGFYGAQRVYGWSFYSQGTREQGQSSADGFFNDAFKWFGYTGEIPKSQHEKGRLLATIIAEPTTQNSKFTLSEAEGHKTLLILDGLEPLQYPPGEMHGRLKDPAMAAFLRTLVRNLDGLCVITSRVFIADLKNTDGRSSRTHPLSQLSEAAGIAVLKSYGLKGPQAEFAKAVEEFKGHALALNLVGSYLDALQEGNIQQRDLIEDLTEDETHGSHARRVMESYMKWFLEENQAEADILYLMGLFDRPANREAIDVLRAEPPIAGLTDRLHHLSRRDWQKALNHLRALRLVAAKDRLEPDTLDCHPLIREHFGQNLQQQHPEAWKEAHSRLYEYYENMPEKELPDTLKEMEPLFAAVMHGCMAGRHQEVFIKVYWNRIQRKTEFYCNKKLGAYGAELSCLSCFFERLWDQPTSGLTPAYQAGALSWAGFNLRAVGRLAEAAQPMKVGVESVINLKDWVNAARGVSTISQLFLALGDVVAAQGYGAKSVTFGDKSGDGFHMESCRATHAESLHQAGDSLAAEAIFQVAEIMQQKRRPGFSYLNSMRGFKFCSLMLDQGKYQEVLKRAWATKELAKAQNWLLDIALNTLSIGKALMLQVLDQQDTQPALIPQPAFGEARRFLDQALEGLRQAGVQEFIVLGLLARAALHRHTQAFPQAWEDLDEALEIATYGQMRLHLTDYHLEAARLVQAQLAAGGESFKVLEEGETLQLSREEMQTRFGRHVAEAERLVEETGYHRRDGEVRSLKV